MTAGDPLAGFEPLPEPKARTPMGRAVEAFAACGEICMGKRYPDRHELYLDYHRAKNYAKNHSLPVRVRRSGDILIFERKPDPTPIEDLDFSVRTFNCLKRAGVNTVAELRGMTDDELRAIRNVSEKTLWEIHGKLGEVGQ